MATYRLLHPAEVQANWSRLREEIGRAVAHGRGELQIDDILALVEDGRMGVLALHEGEVLLAATAFEILTYPRRKVLNFAFTGGRNAKGIVDNYHLIEQIAKQLGADAVQCFCRPAVARFIKRLIPDVEQAYVVMERKVTP